MKTTIKLAGGRSLVIQPAPQGGVSIQITVGGIKLAEQPATPEQAAAAIFALETALGCGGEECHESGCRDQMRCAACPARRRA